MKPKRIQLRRTKGWRLPPNTVVVSRPTRWGNPYRIGTGDPEIQTAREAVVAYRVWLRRSHQGQAIRVMQEIVGLRGKDLACWCPIGEPCHADVLLELANGVTAWPNE